MRTWMRLRQRKARPVAGDELFPLAVRAAVPHGTDGVDHIFAGQTIRPRDFGVAGLAAAQRPALVQQLRPRRSVNAAVHAAPAQKGFICRVDNGVHAHLCNIIANDFQRHFYHQPVNSN